MSGTKIQQSGSRTFLEQNVLGLRSHVVGGQGACGVAEDRTANIVLQSLAFTVGNGKLLIFKHGSVSLV